MREWTITATSDPYSVSDYNRGGFADALERFADDLIGTDGVTASVASLSDGAFGATFVVRAETTRDAADSGCEIFLEALSRALEPLLFPRFAVEVGTATFTIEAPAIASVSVSPETEAAAA